MGGNAVVPRAPSRGSRLRASPPARGWSGRSPRPASRSRRCGWSRWRGWLRPAPWSAAGQGPCRRPARRRDWRNGSSAVSISFSVMPTPVSRIRIDHLAARQRGRDDRLTARLGELHRVREQVEDDLTERRSSATTWEGGEQRRADRSARGWLAAASTRPTRATIR